MRMRLRVTSVAIAACVSALACGRAPGYDPSHPSKITCGCHDGQSCVEGATRVASQRGETAETGEELLYYSQCACFQGSMAGCNMLAHFAKDHVRWCAADQDVARTCTIAGMVHRHGVALPDTGAMRPGRSFPPDQALAGEAFAKACRGGSEIACRAGQGK